MSTVTAFAVAAIPQPWMMAKKDTTSRMLIPVNLHGSRVTVRFSNHAGKKDGIIAHAGIARCSADGVMDPTSWQELTQNGRAQITVPAGQETAADPAEMEVRPGEYLAVSVYCKERPMTVGSLGFLVQNAAKRGADQVSENFEVEPQNLARDEKYNQPMLFSVPYFKGVDIETEDTPRGLLVLGDSITAQARWWYPMVKNLYERFPGKIVSSNYGICGNQLTQDPPNAMMKMFGEAGLKRVFWDGYTDAGVTDVLLALGGNDLGLGKQSAHAVLNGYREFAEEARRRGLKVWGLAIYPAQFGKDHPQQTEADRVFINAEAEKIFDGVCNLDGVLKKPDGIGYIDGISYGDDVHLRENGGQLAAEAVGRFLAEKLNLTE